MPRSNTTPNLPSRSPQNIGGAPVHSNSFRALLDQSAGRIAEVLPRAISPQRFLRLVSVAYHRNPKLQQCTPVSVLSAVMQAAELGLEPGGALGLAYLIPYGRECQFQISYKGMIELAYRTGMYAAIEAELVHAADHFRFRRCPDVRIEHEPAISADRGPVTHAYAYARMISGPIVCELMTRDEIEAVRAMSKQPNSPAWEKSWGEMAKKVVIKRLLKRQRSSPEILMAMEIDARASSVQPAPARAAARLVPHAEASAGEPEFDAETPSLVYSEAEDSAGPVADVQSEDSEDGAWPEGRE
jgi:recombination protein RecT